MRHRQATTASFTLILLFTAKLSCAGNIYNWKDSEGRIHFGDRAPIDVAETKRVKVQDLSILPALDIQILPPTIRRFEVRGTSRYELHQSMLVNGAISDVTQARHWGTCSWSIGWDFTYLTDKKRCQIDAFTLKLDTEIYLPHWANRASAPYELQRKWDSFERAVRTHEDGHRDNGLAAIYDLAGKLRILAPQKDCATLNREISDLGARVTAKYRLRDKAYDQSIINGETRRSAFW